MRRRLTLAAYVLFLVLAFLAGRACGWYEADRFMEQVARELQVQPGREFYRAPAPAAKPRRLPPDGVFHLPPPVTDPQYQFEMEWLIPLDRDCVAAGLDARRCWARTLRRL